MNSSHPPTKEKLTAKRRDLLATATAGMTAVLAGCNSVLAPDGENTSPQESDAASLPGELELSRSEGNVAQSLTVSGRNLPANTNVALVWRGWRGRWEIVADSEIIGPQYSPRTEQLAGGTTDADGRITFDVTVPEAYGGTHPIQLLEADDTLLAESSFAVKPSFELDRTTAPLGSQFTITGRGIGKSRYRRNDQVIWDNGFTGLITGVTDRGTARAKVTAVGPPGEHVLEVGGGYGGISYLNPQQSPYPRDFRYANWKVEVTEPEDPDWQWRRPVVDETPVTGFYSDLDRAQGSLHVTPTSGPVNSTATIEGRDLPGNESITLHWVSMSGNRVSGSGYEKVSEPLKRLETDSRGRFRAEFEVPDDLGGTHPIVAEVGGQSVSVSGFVVQPSIVEFGPTEGPKGTPIDIHIKGVGWTAYDNTYAYVYNNNYVGYACGFNTNGDVQVQLRASGEPGLQTIDLYPALYKKPDESRETDMYMKPHLTYLDDHPGRTLPAMHFIFRVTA